MNGDVLTDIDYGAAAGVATRASDAAATIATHRRKVQISLGVLHFGDAADDHAPDRLLEKPTIDYEVSMGVYCFSPLVLDHIEPGERLDFPDLILRLIERASPSAAQAEDYWLDIGRHDDYEQALEEFERIQSRLLPNA